MTERITKFLIEEIAAKPERVDTEAGILYDVLLLGKESRNKTYYPDSTREQALSMFEGAKVNLSHPAKRDKGALAEPVTWDRRYGRAFECRNTPEGIRGNLKVLKSHSFTKTLMEAAQDMPEMFGFSPVMLGVCTPRDENGMETCVQINLVKSVDIVTDPGTTKSLFEEVDMEEVIKKELKEEVEEKEVEEVEEEIDEIGVLMHTVLNEIEDFAEHKDPQKASHRIGKHLKHHHTMHMKGEGEGEEERAEESEEEEEEKEEQWSFSTRTLPTPSKGTSKVITEEVKQPKYPTKPIKSGTSTTNASETDWAAFLRK